MMVRAGGSCSHCIHTQEGESEQEVRLGVNPQGPPIEKALTPRGSTTFLNSATSWGSGVLTQETMGHISHKALTVAEVVLL